MTEQLYRTDAYLRDCTARVLAVNDRGGIVLDPDGKVSTSFGGELGDGLVGRRVVRGVRLEDVLAPAHLDGLGGPGTAGQDAGLDRHSPQTLGFTARARPTQVLGLGP